ncbi:MULTISPECIES: Gfo/Idh/MocA family protein [unclassified Lentimicrobium]|uniref:Gfo/Idh/MocA family protein n=1 Tax=unclassified Lentimicrobium TaxID=2677434 RepID=UPI001556BBB6|nr:MULTISPECIES: Gfo/Idh/MocA family oxidoreductase [unclassified Lentimicrobium]NPD46115.1 Gfo/Idh/MocA family oxidoreductase [Lentimicrobium sp. S6]NPD86465.1 Gfo/Idh/MocA family oxidoreductase [Lentimicrobium sp. L6]
MAKIIKWGILGLGNIAHKFASDLLLDDGSSLEAVASRDPHNAGNFALQYQSAKAYSSYQDLADDSEVDIIYIATPHTFHYENTMMCLKAGKSVLCEKAFGMNSKEVENMITEAKKRNLFLMEALWTRFIPATEKLLELVDQNTLGEIKHIRADFGFIADKNPNRRLFNKKLGGGSLLDVGIYPVYLSLLLLGLPKEIIAKAQMTKSQVDSYCAMLFDYPNGEKAILESSIESATPVEAYIYGTKGSIKMHKNFHHSKKLSIKLNGQKNETIQIDYIGHGYYHEIREVISCLRNYKTESSKMPHQMSLDLIKTLDRIRSQIGLTYGE